MAAGSAVIFGGGQNAEFAVAGLEDGDADHQVVANF